jgi:hypothetical protein
LTTFLLDIIYGEEANPATVDGAIARAAAAAAASTAPTAAAPAATSVSVGSAPAPADLLPKDRLINFQRYR